VPGKIRPSWELGTGLTLYLNVFVFFNDIAGHGRLEFLSQFLLKISNEMLLVQTERCEPVDRLILQILEYQC